MQQMLSICQNQEKNETNNCTRSHCVRGNFLFGKMKTKANTNTRTHPHECTRRGEKGISTADWLTVDVGGIGDGSDDEGGECMWTRVFIFDLYLFYDLRYLLLLLLLFFLIHTYLPERRQDEISKQKWRKKRNAIQTNDPLKKPPPTHTHRYPYTYILYECT